MSLSVLFAGSETSSPPPPDETVAEPGSLWSTGDKIRPERANRGAILGRLLSPIYDIDDDLDITVTPRSIDGDDVITTETIHYSVPSSDVVVSLVQRLTICNTHTVALQVSLHLVQAAGSRTVGNRIFSDSLVAQSQVTIEGPFILGPSSSIRSISSAATANLVALRGEALEFTYQPVGIVLRATEGVALSTSAEDLYVCPAVTQALLLNVIFCNTDSVSRLVTVYLIQSGGSAVGAKVVFSEPVPAGASVMVIGPFQMDPGDKLSAVAAAGSVVSARPTAVEVE